MNYTNDTLPDSEEVLVKLDSNYFAVAGYYNDHGYWEPGEATNPIEGEESFVLSGNILGWVSIPDNLLLNNSNNCLPDGAHEVLVKLDNEFFAVACYQNGVWQAGAGTHASYRDVDPELSGKVIGWIEIEQVFN
jgi:hypothetical protein